MCLKIKKLTRSIVAILALCSLMACAGPSQNEPSDLRTPDAPGADPEDQETPPRTGEKGRGSMSTGGTYGGEVGIEEARASEQTGGHSKRKVLLTSVVYDVGDTKQKQLTPYSSSRVKQQSTETYPYETSIWKQELQHQLNCMELFVQEHFSSKERAFQEELRNHIEEARLIESKLRDIDASSVYELLRKGPDQDTKFLQKKLERDKEDLVLFEAAVRRIITLVDQHKHSLSLRKETLLSRLADIRNKTSGFTYSLKHDKPLSFYRTKRESLDFTEITFFGNEINVDFPSLLQRSFWSLDETKSLQQAVAKTEEDLDTLETKIEELETNKINPMDRLLRQHHLLLLLDKIETDSITYERLYGDLTNRDNFSNEELDNIEREIKHLKATNSPSN